MKHVIIGAGAAGITAAKTIRALRPADEITMVAEDKQVSSRCMLHKYISGEREAASISFVPEDFFEANGIEWLPGLAVTAVDTAAKEVKCGDRALAYDKLLIATGSVSAIPPIGALRTAKNVYGLRHLSDAIGIREAALKAERVVVIGGGLVGLDAAYALMEMKKDVTVVEMESRILALNLDEKAAKAYQERFEAAGCKFHLGRMMTDTVENEAGDVVKVMLDEGEPLPCDFLVVATGVRPATAFLEGSGVAFERAVAVDKHMETSCPGVYAAGDIAGLSGIWPNAMRQGETAAKNMCGQATVYEDTFAVKNTVNFFGLVSLAVGKQEPGEGDSVETRTDSRNYKKAILGDGQVKGVILQGDISNSGFWQYLIKNGIRIDAIDKPIWKLSFADFYSIDEKGEYHWKEVV
ncbi:MAG: FAD-dependent oxidoreductase [Peptococcaceae bacterium]|jgi:NAD(P)H-nitrite reductase large subunit|nr:FAD-dependent oxidoreductase [Peptococcaceae bacterium]